MSLIDAPQALSYTFLQASYLHKILNCLIFEIFNIKVAEKQTDEHVDRQ